MFNSIQLVAPATKSVTPTDLDHIEDTLSCKLPSDYREFLTRCGPGMIDQEVYIYSPTSVLQRTRTLRELLGAADENGQIRLFAWYNNGTDLFHSQDLNRLLAIGGSVDNDYFVLLPNIPSRYFELPRNYDQIRFAGTTMENFIEYLDPRTRCKPRARRIVANGSLRETDGRSDGTPYLHSFTPEGYQPPAEAVSMVEEEITWGHSDDALVNESLIHAIWAPLPTNIGYHMKHYPLLRLLEEMALRDQTLRFEAEENDVPTAELHVPRFTARLRVGAGMGGLTLYSTVPKEQRTALYRWLAAQAQALGSPIPTDLHALIT